MWNFTGLQSDINFTNGVILQWGFVKNVPKATWTTYSLPTTFVKRNAALIASGLDSDIRVSRAVQGSVKFYCSDSISNVEWVAVGY